MIRIQNALSKVVFGLETTCNYPKPLGAYLIGSGHHLVMVTGKAVKNNRDLLNGRWDKYDIKDSGNVADLISQAKCLYYDHPSASINQVLICCRCEGV